MKLKSVTAGRAGILALAVGSLFLGIVAGPGVATAAKEIQNVFVANDASNPVPVKPVGTTQVQGTVDVANQPTVTVGNQPNAPVPVTSEAIVGDPVTIARNVGAHDAACDGGVLSANEEIYTVPAGKRLIVDHVGVSMQVLDPGYHSIALIAGSIFGPEAKRYPIPTELPSLGRASPGSDYRFGYAVGTDEPHFVMSAGEPLSVRIEQTFGDNTCSVFSQMTVVGRLIPSS